MFFFRSDILDVNYGTNGGFAAEGSSYRGTPTKRRGAIQFDFTSIPQNAVIQSAKIKLKTLNPSWAASYSTQNEFYLKRLTSNWGETTITWNNQPGHDNTSPVLGPATSNTVSTAVELDVTSHVQDMVTNPQNNFGWLLQLQNETQYRLVYFHSSESSDASKRPVVEITYSLPSSLFGANFISTKEVKYESSQNVLRRVKGTSASSFLSSVNKLAANTDGEIQYEIKNSQLSKRLGFCKANLSSYGQTDIKLGIEINNGEAHLIVDGAVNSGTSIGVQEGDKISIKRRGSIYSLEKNGTEWASGAIGSDDELTIGFLFPTSLAVSGKIYSSFDAPVQVSDIQVTAVDHQNRGNVSITSPGNYFFIEGAEFLDAQQFAAYRSKLSTEELRFFPYETHTQFLQSHSLNLTGLPAGKYQGRVYNASGDFLPVSFQISEKLRLEGSGVTISSDHELTTTGAANALSTNVFHKSRSNSLSFVPSEFEYEVVMGFHEVNTPNPLYNDNSTWKYAVKFERQNNRFNLLVNGTVVKSGTYTKGLDQFEINRTAGIVKFYVNNISIYDHIITGDPLRLDLGYSSAGAAKFRYLNVKGCPYWPVISMRDDSKYCGMKSISVQYNPLFYVDPPRYPVSYTWRNEKGELVASELNLNNVPAGIYTLTSVINNPLGLATSHYNVALGYKAEWEERVNSVTMPTSNSIKNDILSIDASAKTENRLPVNNDAWIYFKLRFARYLGGDFLPRLQYNLSFRSPSSSNNNYKDLIVYEYGNMINLIIAENGTLISNSIWATDGDEVILKRVGTVFSVYLNGVLKYTGSLVNNVPFRLKYSCIDVNSSGSIGPEDMVMSFPCKGPIYHDLALNQDGGFYETQDKNLYFRYSGEYNEGTLRYKILKDTDRQDVTASTTISLTQKKFGDNRFEVETKNLPEGYYLLEVTDEKEQQHYLRFRSKY